MLRKIKKYKISLRLPLITKTLKKKLQLEAPVESLEKIVQEEAKKVENLLCPTALYSTFTPAELGNAFAGMWQNAPEKTLSCSLIAVTIGAQFEKSMLQESHQQDEFKKTLLDTIGRDALAQSTHFISRLLAEEARLEGCEYTSPLPMDRTLIQEVLALLESHKAEIHFQENGILSPLYSQVCHSFWIPAKRR